MDHPYCIYDLHMTYAEMTSGNELRGPRFYLYSRSQLDTIKTTRVTMVAQSSSHNLSLFDTVAEPRFHEFRFCTPFYLYQIWISLFASSPLFLIGFYFHSAGEPCTSLSVEKAHPLIMI